MTTSHSSQSLGFSVFSALVAAQNIAQNKLLQKGGYSLRRLEAEEEKEKRPLEEKQ